MRKILKTFKTKTSNVMKRAYKSYSHGFTKFYGPAIEAGLNPFI